MLRTETIRRILESLPRLHVGVVGDLFLDRYLDLDARLTEPSLETGLDAYQVVRVRSYPGAAGTAVNNLAALGVGRVSVLSVIGQDGEGYELRRELDRRRVDVALLLEAAERRTPTYTKPMLVAPGRPAQELHRLDIKNRLPLPDSLEKQLLDRLAAFVHRADAVLVLDQVSEADCGVVTTAVRRRLGEVAADLDKLILADSRERIGLFWNVCLKPNERECRKAVGPEGSGLGLDDCIRRLAARAGRPVLCTQGESGIRLCQPDGEAVSIAGFPVEGPIDPVGAGDSTSAGIACASAAGCSLAEAAAFGCLIASITIQQIATTGTATPEQVWKRWQEVTGQDA